MPDPCWALAVLAFSVSAIAGLMLLYLLGLYIADRDREFKHREQLRAIELRSKQPPHFPLDERRAS